MRPNLLKLFIFFALFGIFVIPLTVNGQITIENPLEYESIDELVKKIIEFLVLLATPVATLMIVIAAFYFVTSSGDPRQIDTAKKMILYTLVGYGIIWLSYGLITVIKQILGVPETGP